MSQRHPRSARSWFCGAAGARGSLRKPRCPIGFTQLCAVGPEDRRLSTAVSALGPFGGISYHSRHSFTLVGSFFLFPSPLLFVFALRSFSELDISVLPLELLTESRRRCSAGQTVPAPGQGRRAGERFAAHRTACSQHREAAGAGRLPNTCPPAISGSPSEARSRAR